jgi:hypothetical protein
MVSWWGEHWSHSLKGDQGRLRLFVHASVKGVPVTGQRLASPISSTGWRRVGGVNFAVTSRSPLAE